MVAREADVPHSHIKSNLRFIWRGRLLFFDNAYNLKEKILKYFNYSSKCHLYLTAQDMHAQFEDGYVVKVSWFQQKSPIAYQLTKSPRGVGLFFLLGSTK